MTDARIEDAEDWEDEETELPAPRPFQDPPRDPKVIKNYMKFKGEEIRQIGGSESMSFEGELLYDFPFAEREVNTALFSELETSLQDWVSKTLQHGAAATCVRPYYNSAVEFAYFRFPLKYFQGREGPEVQKKRNTITRFALTQVMTKPIFDLKRKEGKDVYNDFYMNGFLRIQTKIMGHWVDEEEIYKSELDMLDDLEETMAKCGIRGKYPEIVTFFRLRYHFFKGDLEQGWGFSKDRYKYVSKFVYSQFDYEAWFDNPTDPVLDNYNLRKTIKYYTYGAISCVELCLLLDGIELIYDHRKDKHYLRLKYCMVHQAQMLKDVFSVSEDVRHGNPDNVILLYMAKGNDFATSMAKILLKVEEHCVESAELYEFLLEDEPENNENLVKQTQLLKGCIEGTLSFWLNKEWNRSIKTEIVKGLGKKYDIYPPDEPNVFTECSDEEEHES